MLCTVKRYFIFIHYELKIKNNNIINIYIFNDIGRFRRLKYLDMKKVELVPQTIIACCVLHNICLQFDDNQWMNNLISEQQPNIGDDITAEQLTCYIENTQSGCMKRDQIMVSLT